MPRAIKKLQDLKKYIDTPSLGDISPAAKELLGNDATALIVVLSSD